MGDHRPISSEEGLGFVQLMRNICEKFPECEEKTDLLGHTSFRIRNKPFVIMGEDEKGVHLSIKVGPITQEILLEQGNYYKTPYIGHHGWISTDLQPNVNVIEIEDLIIEAYCRTAPKSITKQFREDDK